MHETSTQQFKTASCEKL